MPISVSQQTGKCLTYEKFENTVVSNGYASYLSFDKQRDWTRTFNFRSLIANKKRKVLLELPENAFSESCRKRRNAQHQLFYRDRFNRSGYIVGNFACASSNNAQSIASMPDARHTELYNKCLSQLPRRMNGNQFSLPIFLAEARKTTDMIRRAALDINKVLSRCKTDRDVHNSWLEYRYGWRLLLKDIVDALKAIHDMRVRGIRQKVKVRQTETIRSDFSLPSVQNSKYIAYTSLTSEADVHEEWYRECVITLIYRDSPDVITTLQQFGITNPVSVAWELIPYSFVVDWFIPIGDYLQQLDTFLGKTFVKGSVSYISDVKRTFRPKNIGFPYPNSAGNYVTGSVLGESSDHFRTYKRVPLVAFPNASLPTIQPNLNVQRCLDAIALLVQRKPSLQRAWAVPSD